MTRSLLGPCLFALSFCLASGSAQAQAEWQAFDYRDDAGRPIAQLVFGVAQTDDAVLNATCSVATQGSIRADFSVNLGDAQIGDPVELTIGTATDRQRRPGTVLGSQVGPYIEVLLAPGDRIWEMLMAASAGNVGLDYAPVSAMHLRGSRAAISRFLSGCDAVFGHGAGGGSVARPLAGPLYTVGGAGADAFSYFRDGNALPPLASGTEVMSTNSTGQANGIEWMEVVTEQGAGQTMWVALDRLNPSSGGAIEYQNLNQVANLVIRAEPSAGAAVVGSVPPQASGIMDEGERYNDWVRVRYGGTIGWASHTYLAPLVDVDTAGGGSAGGGSGSRYEATYGAWMVDCDRCRHPEDGSACAISTPGLGAAVGAFFQPRLSLMAFAGLADAELLYDAGSQEGPEPNVATATLRIAIDGGAAQVIGSGSWGVYGMTGEIFVGNAALTPMLPDLRGGGAVTMWVRDSDGNLVDDFSLDGFSPALDDMMSRMPFESWTEQQCCAAAPESGVCQG